MNTRSDSHAIAPVPWGWILLLGGLAVLGLIVAAGPTVLAHGYRTWPPSAGAWSELTHGARRGLLAGVVVVTVLGLPWQWARGRSRPGRDLGLVWAFLVAASFWILKGYPYNRYVIGSLWRQKADVAGLTLPRALVDGAAWVHNVGLTLAAVALALVLAWLLSRGLPRLRTPAVPKVLLGAALALAALSLPLALRPMAWGRPAPTGPDVILISLDAVRADRLGCYGYPRETTPFLDRFAQRAVRYTRAYCQEPWTLTSHMSMLSGLYPDVHGLDFGRSLSPTVWTVPELLRDGGYRTWGSVYDCFLLSDRFGYAAGFDHYAVTGQPAAQRVVDAADWLLSEDRPGFVFLHFYDPHSDTGALPYEATEVFRQRLAPGATEGFAEWTGAQGASEALRRVNEEELELSVDLREKLGQLYDAGLAETDAAVGAFFDRLEAAGRLESALILVVADHGEALGERDHFMHEKLMEATLRIPFLVRWPGPDRGGEVRDELVETVDLAPTILAAAGVTPPEALQGRDLRLASGGKRVVVFHRSGPDYAVTTEDGWRLAYRWIDGAPQFESLRRVTSDPGDGPDELAQHPDVIDALLDLVVDHHEANAVLARRQRGADVDMSEADRELLRSLGYID